MSRGKPSPTQLRTFSTANILLKYLPPPRRSFKLMLLCHSFVREVDCRKNEVPYPDIPDSRYLSAPRLEGKGQLEQTQFSTLQAPCDTGIQGLVDRLVESETKRRRIERTSSYIVVFVRSLPEPNPTCCESGIDFHMLEARVHQHTPP
jgi:hypothetical protein